MLENVLLYVPCVGVPSSRRTDRRLQEDSAFRVLAANNSLDIRTISDFRKDRLAASSALSFQALELCRRTGLVNLGLRVLDGTKVRANASKQKAMSYQWTKERETQLPADV